jgi:hypothetical protein
LSGRNDLWGSVNTLLEIGIEIYRLMHENGSMKGSEKNTSVEKMMDGVLLMSNEKEILIAVSKETANQLSDAARTMGTEKGEYLCFIGAATAIPLFEFSRTNDSVRDYIVSEESLRATLCGNYPEYVKTHNMNAPPGEQIKDADAPPYLFLQKQLDNEADKTRLEVAEYQQTHSHETNNFERLPHEELEL